MYISQLGFCLVGPKKRKRQKWTLKLRRNGVYTFNNFKIMKHELPSTLLPQPLNFHLQNFQSLPMKNVYFIYRDFRFLFQNIIKN